ncbi:MAG: hypothetical protein U9P90_03585, partial [Patescibacteria group bacterium]|nr:hypothetical protein [Patescibacteria group bacterium]
IMGLCVLNGYNNAGYKKNYLSCGITVGEAAIPQDVIFQPHNFVKKLIKLGISGLRQEQQKILVNSQGFLA